MTSFVRKEDVRFKEERFTHLLNEEGDRVAPFSLK